MWEHVSIWACCEHLRGVCVYRVCALIPQIRVRLENETYGWSWRGLWETLAEPPDVQVFSLEPAFVEVSSLQGPGRLVL